MQSNICPQKIPIINTEQIYKEKFSIKGKIQTVEIINHSLKKLEVESNMLHTNTCTKMAVSVKKE